MFSVVRWFDVALIVWLVVWFCVVWFTSGVLGLLGYDLRVV